jgi:ABC-2 type transport system ATP-binding protein
MNKFVMLNQIFKLDMNKKVGDLSRGQQMRFAFMLSMAANTEIIIMDEPTAGIDAIAKKEFFDVLVKEVEERGLTVLITSHELTDLEKICDSVTLVKGGKVIGNDGLDQVKQTVRKFNLVFKNGVFEEFLAHPKLVSYSNMGSVYTTVFSGITEEEVEALHKYEPDYVEELKVNLEEVFVYANGGE